MATAQEEEKTYVPPGVPEFWVGKYKNEAAKNWDRFYKRNTTHFFKDRHWIEKEFEDYAPSGHPRVALEVGCGVGNFIYPVLAANHDLRMFACDFSDHAIRLVKEHQDYDQTRLSAFVADLTVTPLASVIPPGSVDLVSSIFVLSAIPPEKQALAVENIASVTRPGGYVLFRDYGEEDQAQLRFKSPAKISEKLFVRQDGTLSYFFSPEELSALFTAAGFETISTERIVKETVNRREGKTFSRVFIQGKFRRRLPPTEEDQEREVANALERCFISADAP